MSTTTAPSGNQRAIKVRPWDRVPKPIRWVLAIVLVPLGMLMGGASPDVGGDLIDWSLGRPTHF